MEIEYSENGNRRVITRDMDGDPFRNVEEFKCISCGKWINHECVVWARADGTLSTMEGDAYCEGCCPPEPDYEI